MGVAQEGTASSRRKGDSNDRPSYSHIWRLFPVGYLKGLREAVYG